MRITGVYAAMLTPLNHDGSINIKEAKKITNFLIEKGVDGIFAVSSIGEGINFDAEESVELAKAVFEEANNRVKVVPGATTTCMYNTIKLIEKYKKFGCDTVVIAPPYFYSTRDEDIIKHYEDVIEKTGVNVLVYNIPLFSTPISDYVIQKLTRNPRIVGIKDSSGNSVNFMQILDNIRRNNSATSALIGREEIFLSGLQMGADGCMVGSASIIPEVMVAIKEAYKKENLENAKKYQESIVELVKKMFQLPFPLGFKYALERRGFQMGGIRKSVDYEKIANAAEIQHSIEVLMKDALKNVGAELEYK